MFPQFLLYIVCEDTIFIDIDLISCFMLIVKKVLSTYLISQEGGSSLQICEKVPTSQNGKLLSTYKMQ